MIAFICLYLSLVANAIMNKLIIDTQDSDDNQIWHIGQLISWIVFYGIILVLTEFRYLAHIIAFALTYPFLYDGILNLLMKKNWLYEGIAGFGKDYTIPAKYKIILFVFGAVLWLLILMGI